MPETDYNWYHEYVNNDEETFYDDMSGELLDPQLVKKARAEELEYAGRYNVFDIVDLAVCWQATGKAPIKVRWVDVNKGDDVAPNYRSRFVAREIRRKGEDPLFAPTPPPERLRTVLSPAATSFANSVASAAFLGALPAVPLVAS